MITIMKYHTYFRITFKKYFIIRESMIWDVTLSYSERASGMVLYNFSQLLPILHEPANVIAPFSRHFPESPKISSISSAYHNTVNTNYNQFKITSEIRI